MQAIDAEKKGIVGFYRGGMPEPGAHAVRDLEHRTFLKKSSLGQAREIAKVAHNVSL